jgi:hypothetical protein
MINEAIVFLSRNKIDIEKYNICIENSNQNRIYAFSWYLDIVADDWGVYVLGDYKAVMPLPFMRSLRSFYFKKIEQPPFCQQLGVFYKGKIPGVAVSNFLSSFYENSPNSYHFNSTDTIENRFFSTTYRKNFELDLGGSYEDIKNNYSKNLVRNIKKANKNQLKIIDNVALDVFMEMKISNKKHTIKNKNLRKTSNLILELTKRNYGCMYGVKFGDQVIATAFISKNKGRVIHLFSASSMLGKQLGAISYLFDNLIKNNCGENYIFDFEGGNIPSIARFYKSFGTTSVDYFRYSKTV